MAASYINWPWEAAPQGSSTNCYNLELACRFIWRIFEGDYRIYCCEIGSAVHMRRRVSIAQCCSH